MHGLGEQKLQPKHDVTFQKSSCDDTVNSDFESHSRRRKSEDFESDMIEENPMGVVTQSALKKLIQKQSEPVQNVVLVSIMRLLMTYPLNAGRPDYEKNAIL